MALAVTRGLILIGTQNNLNLVWILVMIEWDVQVRDKEDLMTGYPSASAAYEVPHTSPSEGES
jgi:hypothetical protein